VSLEVLSGTEELATPDGAFYFDFSSPEAYLAAERVLQILPVVAEWVPIRPTVKWDGERADIERTAAARGLQSVRWPGHLPDGELALLAATYAKSVGRIVSFTLAAFRQAYAGGHDLDDRDVVLIAGSACEMHPRAVLVALERKSVAAQLGAASALAREQGVVSTPAVWLADGTVHHGDAALDSL
jgi:2-hydroxychromene-2-carboxylate isomerase